MYNGIVNVKKEAGYTSFDVVAVLRGIFGQRKVGHTGTLDPEAEGVLPVCLGNATKLCDMLGEDDKEYVTELLLGVTTDTQDITGTILEKKEVPHDADTEALGRLILDFVGEYDQIPPMYSAIKVGGKRLYELARKGVEVERKPRRVHIKEIEILDVSLPVVKMRVICSKGTYIRTLCHDIGIRSGLGGTMKSLIRTRVGRFEIQYARTISQLQELKDTGRLSEAVSRIDSIFEDCPMLHILEKWRKLAENGNEFLPEHTVEQAVFPAGEWVRVYSGSGQEAAEMTFVGIYAYHQEKKRYCPVKLFQSR